MNDIGVEDFADMLCFLDPCPPSTKKHDSWGTRCKSQKAHMVIWFESQTGTGAGAFTRSAGNTSAKAAYNRLLNAGALVWIADALGEDPDRIAQAAQAAKDAEKVNFRKRCGAFREVIPFSRVIELYNQPGKWRYDPALLPLVCFDSGGYPDFKPDTRAKAETILERELG